jgi:hypothetical protein
VADEKRIEPGRGKMLPQFSLARLEVHCGEFNKETILPGKGTWNGAAGFPAVGQSEPCRQDFI